MPTKGLFGPDTGLDLIVGDSHRQLCLGLKAGQNVEFVGRLQQYHEDDSIEIYVDEIEPINI